MTAETRIAMSLSRRYTTWVLERITAQLVAEGRVAKPALAERRRQAGTRR